MFYLLDEQWIWHTWWRFCFLVYQWTVISFPPLSETKPQCRGCRYDDYKQRWFKVIYMEIYYVWFGASIDANLMNVSHKMWKEIKGLGKVIWYSDVSHKEEKYMKEQNNGVKLSLLIWKGAFTFRFYGTAVSEELVGVISNRPHNTSPLNSSFLIFTIPWKLNRQEV